MDLGKMLAEALEGESVISTLNDLEPLDFRKLSLDGFYNLNAAAEAFLAKVREAQIAEAMQGMENRSEVDHVVDLSHPFGGDDWRDPRFVAAYEELQQSDPLWEQRTSSDRIAATYERAGMERPPGLVKTKAE